MWEKNGALNKKKEAEEATWKLQERPNMNCTWKQALIHTLAEVAEAMNLSQMPSQSYYELLAHIKWTKQKREREVYIHCRIMNSGERQNLDCP